MERFYLAAICATVPGLGRTKIPGLLELLGGAEQLWSASFEQLANTKLVTDNQINNFLNHRQPELPEKLKGFCLKQGIQLLTFLDKAYPEGLRQISDFPLVLYVRGRLPETGYSMAIVGSRAASPYGIEAAEEFSKAFAANKINIISGGARGIDTAAHKACLETGGITVVVLGCGIDKVYPAENKELFREIVDKGGALVSEYAPGVPPLANNFPARNRIIVGLADGVLVAECALKSGAIITANIAADEGRDVYCVPGNIFNGWSKGCHSLIRNGAQLVDSPEDVLTDLTEWQGVKSKKLQSENIFTFTCPLEERPQNNKYDKLSEEARSILTLLGKGRLTLTEIIEKQGGNLADLGTQLLDLQVAGLVAQDNAQRYYLK